MPQPADFILTSARVLTQDPAQPRAEAVAVRGGRIAFVGSALDAGGWRGPGTRVIDGQGATLIPGLIDSHFHLLSGALTLEMVPLAEATTPAEVAAAVRAHRLDGAEPAWVRGRGLRYAVFPPDQPVRRQLDAIVADRPMLLTSYDGHTAWANTRALELAGLLGGELPADSGADLDDWLRRDAAGVPTGELREAAMDLVRRHLPKPDSAQQRRLVRQALRLLAQAGLTSVHNMDGSLEQLQLYAAMEYAGELTLRVYVPYSVTPTTTPDQLAEAVTMRELAAEGAPLARGGAAKFFMDGVLESHTALMVAPYADRPELSGAGLHSLEQFTTLAVECDRLGLQICVHCCGDGAVRRTLDGYAAVQHANGRRDSRHRVEHIEVIHPDDQARFRELGVLASLQPLHAPTGADSGDIWLASAGRERWRFAFAWRTLREAGARQVFGSDWPVVTYDPLRGIQAARTRRPWQPGDPDQSQTLAETLASYTREAAYAEFQEHTKGQLRTGMAADLVLLSADLEATPPDAIADVRPVLTMLDGRVVFES